MINLTSSAKNYLTDTTKKHNKKYAYLGVLGGGCSGFQYDFSFTDKKNDDDIVYKDFGINYLIDTSSIEFISGGQLEYVDELAGSYFKIENPNATANCGCGTSFSI